MAGKALLIGVALDGLSGVANDVAAIEAALKDRGITAERCVGPEATRDGILAAYERLIAAVGPDEAAVVYYSGHGGIVTPPPTDLAEPEPGTTALDRLDLQFIVPYDFHSSQPGNYNAITSVELSVLQARLTRKTENVVVILDCCHSGRMSKEPGSPVQKELKEPEPYEELWAQVRGLQAAGKLDTSLIGGTDNQKAVRIVACSPDQAAWEYDGVEGRIGVLTESLVMALAEAGDEPVTWSAVIGRVRSRVMDLFASQRPEAEGPSQRLLFSSQEADFLNSVPMVDIGGGRVALGLAPMLGIGHGDTFTVMPGSAPGPDDATKIGDLTVDRVGPLEAQGVVRFAGTWTKVPVDARAHRVGVSAPRIPVLLPEPGPGTAALTSAVEAAPLLRAAEPGETWQAAVRLDEGGGLTVEDTVGPVHPEPRAADGAGVKQVVHDLTAMARASVLRRLAADANWELHAGVTVEWGLVRAGERGPLPNGGALVPTGSLIYADVHNGGDESVYVSIIDIGVTGRITVLTRSAPSGVKLAPGRNHLFGQDSYSGAVKGVPLTWPAGLERRVRPERLLVLVTSEPHDVTILQQGGAKGRGDGRKLSVLQEVLDQISTGEHRDLDADEGPVALYDLLCVEFEHDPTAAGGTDAV